MQFSYDTDRSRQRNRASRCWIWLAANKVARDVLPLPVAGLWPCRENRRVIPLYPSADGDDDDLNEASAGGGLGGLSLRRRTRSGRNPGKKSRFRSADRDGTDGTAVAVSPFGFTKAECRYYLAACWPAQAPVSARRRPKLLSQTIANLSHRRHGGRAASAEGHLSRDRFLAGLDVSIFRALNDFCGWSAALDRVVVHLEVLKGSIFMGIVGVLWYWPDKEMPRRRETILIMILAVALSLVVNRVISSLLPYRDRPMYAIGTNAPTFEWHADLEHWSSFPSDNATYLLRSPPASG